MFESYMLKEHLHPVQDMISDHENHMQWYIPSILGLVDIILE
jgi:hypothetical protein